MAQSKTAKDSLRLEKLDRAVEVRQYIAAKDIIRIDSDCGYSEDCWIVYWDSLGLTRTGAYISRKVVAKLIFE